MSGHDRTQEGDFSNGANSLGQKASNPKYRTKLCRNYPLGTCRYGEHCSYLHILPVASLGPQPSYQPMHPFGRFPFYPRVSSSGGAPSHLATSTAPYRTPNSPRAQPHRDTRLRAPRPEVPRRFATVAPSNPGSDVSSVEQWRLSVPDGMIPPAPPGTPVSVASIQLAGTPTPASSSLGMGVGQLHERSGKPMSQTSSTTRRESQCSWEGCVGGTRREEVYPLLVERPGTAAKPMRHRNQYFKTKPCRFYGEPGGCIKGDRCNFIHEHPDEARRPSGLPAPAPLEAVSEGEPESGAESSVQGESPSTVATSDHTPSVTSGESKKSNFFPVTWRVVGGGVMMSGKRDVCENFMAGHCPDGADCRFAHPETTEEMYTPYQEPPPVYSPISPILSPVVFAYPVMYPTLSPPQPFALPAVIPGSPSPLSPSSQTPKTGFVPPHLAVAPQPQIQVQPCGGPYPYSPHRVVDGTTLAERQPEPYSQIGRPVVRPVSTPPTPMQVPDAGVARLFAAEMP